MTRRIRPDQLLAIVLGLAIALLAGDVAWQIARYGARGDNGLPQSTKPAELPEIPDVFNLPKLAADNYSEIAERPVFSASRRPATGPARAAVSKPTPRSPVAFELVGLVGDGDRRLALIRPRGSQEVVQLAAGETYREWTVAEIGADFVVVQSGEEEQELRLAYKPR